MDLFTLLEYYVKTYAAGRLVLLAGCAAMTTGIVDLLKMWKPDFQGNIIKTITLGVAFLVTLVAFLSAGAFNPITWPDVGAFFAVTGLVWLSATGIHEVAKNRNPGEVPTDASRSSRKTD